MRDLARIALISEHASPLARCGGQDAGGQNVYVDELSRHLGQLGHRVDVFTRRDQPELPEVVEWAPGVRVVHLAAGPARYVPKDALWPHMPELLRSFLRFQAREGGEYAVLHGNFWMSGWVALQLRRRLGIPMVQLFHATGTTKRRHQGQADTSPVARIPVELAIAREADALIAQCPNEWDELVRDYGARPERMALIAPAVDTRVFRPVPRAEARRHIGLEPEGSWMVYVGRILPRKDVRNVVRALALLARERGDAAARPSLLVVGGESDAPDPLATAEIAELRRLARELGVESAVRFAGRQPAQALCDYYSAGDVVVTTPWYEPFGLTPLEGMACGRPVIGAAVGGISFTIRDGETGYLVPPRDPVALADRLRELLSQPALRERMGLAARRHVEREFSWTRTAAQTAALYQRLRAGRERARPDRGPRRTVPLAASDAAEAWCEPT